MLRSSRAFAFRDGRARGARRATSTPTSSGGSAGGDRPREPLPRLGLHVATSGPLAAPPLDPQPSLCRARRHGSRRPEVQGAAPPFSVDSVTQLRPASSGWTGRSRCRASSTARAVRRVALRPRPDGADRTPPGNVQVERPSASCPTRLERARTDLRPRSVRRAEACCRWPRSQLRATSWPARPTGPGCRPRTSRTCSPCRGPLEVPVARRPPPAGLRQLHVPRPPPHPPAGAHLEPAFAGKIETRRLFFVGASQGGVLGGALTAVAPDFDRAALMVPGMNFSLLITRSNEFTPFATSSTGATATRSSARCSCR